MQKQALQDPEGQKVLGQAFCGSCRLMRKRKDLFSSSSSHIRYTEIPGGFPA